MVIAVGVPTVVVIITVLITCAEGPLQPHAVTSMFTLPEKPFAQVIIPVDEPIDPADGLLNDQMNPVLFEAVVAYVVVVVPLVSLHAGSVPAEMVIAVGVPTVGDTVTVATPERLFKHSGADW